MLTSSITNLNTPRLQLQDTVAKAKQLINDFKFTHLPVVAEHVFIGLIGEDDLLDADDKQSIQSLEEQLLISIIPDDVHFLVALQYCNLHESNIAPVVSRQNEFLGVITAIDLLKIMGNFSGANEIGGLVILEMERVHFSISEISRIVESNDCTILHMNTSNDPANGLLNVTLHLNRREISPLIATFERYEYVVKYHFGAQMNEEKSAANYLNLMKYLNV